MSRGLGCSCTGKGSGSGGCHGNQRSAAASSAQGLRFQKLVSEWSGLPGTSEPFPMETMF